MNIFVDGELLNSVLIVKDYVITDDVKDHCIWMNIFVDGEL